MKSIAPWSVRIASLAAATVITVLIVAAHGMDQSDLGGHEVLVSAPVTIASDASRGDAGPADR